MIEKLDIKNGGVEDLLNCIKKINELVDVVNELQCKNVHIESDLQDLMYPKEIKGELGENVQDKFAEQRKWIGKLCWFWNRNDKHCGILTTVFDNNKYGKDDQIEEYPYQRDSIGSWQHCEPVKPDDDIIYKTKGE